MGLGVSLFWVLASSSLAVLTTLHIESWSELVFQASFYFERYSGVMKFSIHAVHVRSW